MTLPNPTREPHPGCGHLGKLIKNRHSGRLEHRAVGRRPLQGGLYALATLAWVALGVELHIIAQDVLGRLRMTWNSALTWFIMPAVVAS